MATQLHDHTGAWSHSCMATQLHWHTGAWTHCCMATQCAWASTIPRCRGKGLGEGGLCSRVSEYRSSGCGVVHFPALPPPSPGRGAGRQESGNAYWTAATAPRGLMAYEPCHPCNALHAGPVLAPQFAPEGAVEVTSSCTAIKSWLASSPSFLSQPRALPFPPQSS